MSRGIYTERLATCLDLAVLFAACIEAIGLRPVIVLIRDSVAELYETP